MKSKLYYIIFSTQILNTLFSQLICTNSPYIEDAVVGARTTFEREVINQSFESPIEIDEIKPSCGCTIVKKYDNYVPAGGKIIISGDMVAPSSDNLQSIYLCIKYHYTNKSTQNYAVVNVIRKIINPIIISKEKINFGEIDASKNYKTNIDIRIDKSFVKNIIIDESKSLEKVADLKIKTNSLDQCMLSLIFNKHKKIAGTIKGSVKIRADIIKPVKYKYIWDVPVYAFIKSEFQVSPEFLIIPKININEEHEECITIYSTNSFILKSVTDSNSDNLCKFKTSQSSINKSAVNITYLGSDSSGSLSGYLNIEIVLKNNNQTFYFRIPYVKI